MAEKLPDLSGFRIAYQAAYRAPEAEVLSNLIGRARLPLDAAQRVGVAAGTLVDGVRAQRNGGGMESFLREYGLSTPEGVVLMCLAEALLRVPDAETASRLIADKIGSAEWDRHVGKSDSLFVNASTWALMLTGQLVQPRNKTTGDPRGMMRQLLARGGEPVIRQAVTRAMRILGRQYVLGRTIGEALGRTGNGNSGSKGGPGKCYSFDMLGEAAKTAHDARRYFAAYVEAIGAIGAHRSAPNVYDAPGISVKLSALHPRFEYSQRPRVMAELSEKLTILAVKARDAGIGITIDAEESDRLDLTLDLFALLLDEPGLAGWDGLGLAVQAYQKRAYPVIEWLEALARAKGRRLMIRLVKGAYWDTEIKRAQEDALLDYPVFTRKAATDVSYLACARRMLEAPDAFYPQFATHNAHTLASILEMAGASRQFEFQRLHGMGEALYAQIEGAPEMIAPVRVYAPVGSHEDLLPYLVRRLLENGANTSFVHHLADTEIPTERLTADPVMKIERVAAAPNRRIPRPLDLYAPERVAAPGVDLSDETVVATLLAGIEAAMAEAWQAGPIINGQIADTTRRPAHSPADNRVRVGQVGESSAEHVDAAIEAAFDAASDWNATSAEARAAVLERAADLFQANAPRLTAMCIREAGKTLPDAVSEIREAVDFCRYYAIRARRDFGAPLELPGPTGESNQLEWRGRGVFACISPWNFPLAIFAGQVTAALAAGNAVVAKPAEQTPLIAAEAVRLLHRAGVPTEVLHLLPGPGAAVGAQMVADPRIAGVAFTGSTETARRINQSLANRPGPIVPLIAETGGQNAMIVDSTALPEQVVGDCITSAFQSAGQRCSALRVLFVQDEIAPRLLDMLRGAMDELVVGEPGRLSTDVGPIIDSAAVTKLKDHIVRMEREGNILHACAVPGDCDRGSYFFGLL
ncbi:MAG: bifunctional proline dehydrogenase/L-glutamate gamma-semialdehyde dehydrogenase PutA, partial [Proteobacteria bacterium]|nr:bifunctional proline dehydrogenase/L-glutamate gamma-semialdehyde dehydrogenase PutA [Pseudomonadota bacterium]